MRKKGAVIRSRELRESREARELAKMPGQEVEKKGEVAAVGGDCVRRGAPLAGQPCRPEADRGAQILGGGEPGQRQRVGKQRELARCGSTGQDRPRLVCRRAPKLSWMAGPRPRNIDRGARKTATFRGGRRLLSHPLCPPFSHRARALHASLTGCPTTRSKGA